MHGVLGKQLRPSVLNAGRRRAQGRRGGTGRGMEDQSGGDRGRGRDGQAQQSHSSNEGVFG